MQIACPHSVDNPVDPRSPSPASADRWAPMRSPRRRPRPAARRAPHRGVRAQRAHERRSRRPRRPARPRRQEVGDRGRGTISASRPSRRRTRRASAAPTRSPTRPRWRGPSSRPPRRDGPRAVALIDARDWHAGIAGAVLASRRCGRLLLSDGPELPRAAATRSPPCSRRRQGRWRRPGRARRRRRPPAGPAHDRHRRPRPVRAGPRDGRLPGRGARRERRSRDRRLRRRPRLRDAGGRVGGQGRRPGAVRAPRQPAPETKAALLAHDQPKIYVLGPPATVGASVVTELKAARHGQAPGRRQPLDNAIAFARYSDGDVRLGRGRAGPRLRLRERQAAGGRRRAAPLSASGKYAPYCCSRCGARPRRRGGDTCSTSSRGTERPGARRLQSRLDHRRRESHLRGDAGRHRRAAGDQEGPVHDRRRPAGRERSREPKPQGRPTTRSPSRTSAS